jgi:hypothetical protein
MHRTKTSYRTQAAAALGLTGPKVTALVNKNIDAFTLEELVNLLPALELTVQVVAEPQRYRLKPQLVADVEDRNCTTVGSYVAQASGSRNVVVPEPLKRLW